MVILIATKGRYELLKRTLTSISMCTLPKSLSTVIVVENGSKRKTESLVLDFSSKLPIRYEYINVANKSIALNYVLKKFPNCLVLFTDDDVRFNPDTLLAYEKASFNTTHGVFFGGRVNVDYEKEPREWLKLYLPDSARGWKHPSDCPSYFIGFNWAAYADDIRNAGFFNPNLDVNRYMGVETDMQIRLIQNGISRQYLHHAVVWHYVPKSRCSPIWALKRAYKIGFFGEGIFAEPQELDFIDYPKWMHRNLFREKKIPFLKRISLNNLDKIYGKLYWFFLYSGYIHGMRKKTKNNK